MNDDATMIVGFLACMGAPAAVLLALIALGAFDGLPGMAVFLVICALGIAMAVMFTKYMFYMASRERGRVDSPRRFGGGSRRRTCRRCR